MADKATDVTLDFSTFQPIKKPKTVVAPPRTSTSSSVVLDFSTFQPISSSAPAASHTPQPLARTPANYAKEIASGVAKGVPEGFTGLYQTLRHPINTAHDLLEQTRAAHAEKEKVRAQGEGIAGQTLTLAENAPIIGPLVKSAERGGTRSFSPESVGATAEAVAAFEAPGIAGKAIGKLGKTEGVRGAIQSGLGAGKSLVKETAKRFERDTTAAERVNKKAEKTFEEAKAKLDDRHRTDVEAAIEKHKDDTVAREQKIRELEADHADKVAEARKKWVDTAHDKLSDADKQTADATKREGLERDQRRTNVPEAINNLKSTYQAIRSDFNQRWQGIRDFVKDPETGTEYATVNPKSVLDAVADARKKLAGTPPSLAILNQVENVLSDSGSMIADESGNLTPKAKDSISFTDARTHAHEILDQAYGAEDALTSKVLFQIYDAYDKQLREAVKEAGVQRSLRSHDPLAVTPPTKSDIAVGEKAVKQYDDLKNDWKEFKTDWDDKGAVSKSASPLVNARQVHEMDTGTLISQLNSASGRRLIATVSKYSKYGADPKILARVLETDKEIKQLPELSAESRAATTAPISARMEVAGVKPPPVPPKPSQTLVNARRSPLPETPNVTAPDRPAYPPKPPKIETKVPDLEATRLDKVERKIATMQELGKWDFFAIVSTPVAAVLAGMFGYSPGEFALSGPAVIAGKVAVARLMENPKFLNWIKQDHVRDLQALDKLPENIKEPLKAQINQHIAAKAASRHPIAVGPELRKWLSRGAGAAALTGIKDNKPNAEIPVTPDVQSGDTVPERSENEQAQ